MNRLLAVLSPADLAALAAEDVVLVRGDTLVEAGTRISHVHFPQTAVISGIVHLSDGRAIDTGTIGCEGVVGSFAVEADDTATISHAVQIGGRASRVAIERLRALHAASARVRGVLASFHQALITQMSQNTACNAAHDVASRLAKLLLTCHDRNADDVLPLTHELLAELLGASRPRVSLATVQLQAAGALKSGYGSVQVIDRDRLETSACECYRRIRDTYDRLLPSAGGAARHAANTDKLCAPAATADA